jgi:phosphatidylserine synthase 2
MTISDTPYFQTALFAIVVVQAVHYAWAFKKSNLATKIINTLIILYSALLVYGLILSAGTRQSVLNFIATTFGGKAGLSLPEKDYGDVCAIYVPNHPSGDPFFNVTDRKDIFVVAHSLGWFVKTLVLRDVKTAWICSILFEIMELCFAHLLPNFNECWWDSVIMDIFGCNMIGIYLADFVLTITGATKFNFFDRGFLSTRKSKSENFKAIFSVCLLTILISLIDLNFFFLKFVLYFPTTHPVCYVRTLLWVLISIPGAWELYRWSSQKPSSSPQYSRSCLIGCVGLAFEMAFYTLLRGDSFKNATPTPLPTYLLVVTLVYATIWSAVKATSSRS